MYSAISYVTKLCFVFFIGIVWYIIIYLVFNYVENENCQSIIIWYSSGEIV